MAGQPLFGAWQRGPRLGGVVDVFPWMMSVIMIVIITMSISDGEDYNVVRQYDFCMTR